MLADYLYSVGSNLYQSVMNRSVEEVGRDMKVVRGPSEYTKPVNVGLMFFNEDPEDFFPCARIEVVDKPDPTGRGMTEKTFRGPLDKQLRDALAYIQNYIIKEFITKVPDSELAVRAFNWPYAAVEEALSNAVYHKSYQIHEPITVMITPEKMEIIRGCSGGAEPICMIGDGVNDALALVTADAGIAMGGIGSDIAIESADAVLAGDDIKRLPYLFGLMQKVMGKIRVNIIASLIINCTAVILSALGILTPVTGALWHNFGSVFVVVNAAALLRVKDED